MPLGRSPPMRSNPRKPIASERSAPGRRWPTRAQNGIPLVRGFAQLGYTQNDDLVFERRGAEGHIDRLPRLVEELVAAKVDLIVTFGYPAALAAKQRTTIPVVAIFAGDPVGIDFVATATAVSESSAVLFRMLPCGVVLVLSRFQVMTECNPGMMRGLLVIARFVVLGGFAMMFGSHRRTDANSRHPDAYGSQHLLGRNHHQRRHAVDEKQRATRTVAGVQLLSGSITGITWRSDLEGERRTTLRWAGAVSRNPRRRGRDKQIHWGDGRPLCREIRYTGTTAVNAGTKAGSGTLPSLAPTHTPASPPSTAARCRSAPAAQPAASPVTSSITPPWCSTVATR